MNAGNQVILVEIADSGRERTVDVRHPEVGGVEAEAEAEVRIGHEVADEVLIEEIAIVVAAGVEV